MPTADDTDAMTIDEPSSRDDTEPVADKTPSATSASRSTGILPSQELRAAIQSGEIGTPDGAPIGEDQIQPASFDLRLGPTAHRVRASFLPGTASTVRQKLDMFAMHEIDLTEGAVLEKGCVYIVPLLESLALRRRTRAIANPKSSTGRLDIFARLITDNGVEFDTVPERYRGALFLEVAPRSFSIVVRQGTRLSQMRIKRGSPPTTEVGLRRLNAQVPLTDSDTSQTISRRGLAITVDTEGDGKGGPIGYRARKHAGLIDVERIGAYDPEDYWEPIPARRGRGLILDPDDFYILASKESVTVPFDHAAEMLAYDTLVGEFRVHYAGFFDPGFGHADASGAGTRAVLEVRSHEVPFVVDDGQTVGRLVYERLTAPPDKIYGRDIGSSYQRQGLTLSKQFKR